MRRRFSVNSGCLFFASRRRHTICWRDWSSDVCSSDLRQGSREGRMSASITLPPTMFREVEQLAVREGRIVGEVLQEAVRRYLIQTQIRELQTYGMQQSQDLGLAE